MGSTCTVSNCTYPRHKSSLTCNLYVCLQVKLNTWDVMAVPIQFFKYFYNRGNYVCFTIGLGTEDSTLDHPVFDFCTATSMCGQLRPTPTHDFKQTPVLLGFCPFGSAKRTSVSDFGRPPVGASNGPPHPKLYAWFGLTKKKKKSIPTGLRWRRRRGGRGRRRQAEHLHTTAHSGWARCENAARGAGHEHGRQRTFVGACCARPGTMCP